MERFYLIVGHVSQLELLVPHGVRLVQLRIKDQPEAEVRRQIARARDFCAVHGAQLVVNDYWQAALDKQPDLHFTVRDVFAGHEMMVITYENHRGVLAAETLYFGADGLVTQAAACHAG